MGNQNYRIACPSFDEFILNQDRPVPLDNFRSKALDFAYPIDAGIIRLLDNRAVNSIFSEIVDISINMDKGLTLASGIRVDEHDPEVREILRRCSEVLQIDVPYTVISASVRGLNAYTVGTDAFSYIVVGSLTRKLLTIDELAFVLGHECGHVALGHVVYHTAMNCLRAGTAKIPVIGELAYDALALPMQTWSRCSEISADRAGLLCCKDVETACRTLLRLEAGGIDISNFSVRDYIRDAKAGLKRAYIGKYAELLNSHPIIAKRIEALTLFAGSEKYYRITGQIPDAGMNLLDDEMLESKTENVIKIL